MNVMITCIEFHKRVSILCKAVMENSMQIPELPKLISFYL